MATSPVSSASSASSTAAEIQAANKAAAQRLLSSLNAGSGVDVASLAQNLVDAERIPKENAINAKISKNEGKINGLSAVMFMMRELQTKLAGLKDKTNYNALTASNSNASALNVTTTNNAVAGTYNVAISSLAKPQRSLSSGYATPTTLLNGGLPFNLVLGASKPGVSTGSTTNNAPYRATIQAPSFASPPTTSDFGRFNLAINGAAYSFTPAPASATLSGLAADLQSQLRAVDATMSVSVSDGNLVIQSSDITRRLTQVGLTLNTAPVAGTPTTNDTETATLSGLQSGIPATAQDYTQLSITIDGNAYAVTPAPASSSLVDLAADLQVQLQAATGNTGLTVNVSGSDLVFDTGTPGSMINSLTMTARAGASGGAVGTPKTGSVMTFMADITGVSFGSDPSVTDFKQFSVTVDGKAYNLIPRPATADLNALASDLQAQLRALDGRTDLSVTVNANRLSITSSDITRKITDPQLSASTTIPLDTGASVGTPSAKGNSISGIRFGNTPQVTDFKSFTVKIGENVRTVIPAPETPTLAGLAADLQKRLRVLEGSNDIVVSDAGGVLTVTSASGKDIRNIGLTRTTYTDTPEGIVAAINDANRGLKAELVNDGSLGSPYKVMVTGASGSTEAFTLSSNAANGPVFTTSAENMATDAELTVNGVQYRRKANTLADVISGVTLELRSITNGGAPASVTLTQDTSAVKEQFKSLVVAYNDFDSIVKETTDPKSSLDTYGKTLVGDPTVKMVRMQIRSLFLGQSSTSGAAITSLGDLGFKTDQKGVLSLDEAKLDAALKNNYGDIVKAMTGNQTNISKRSTQPAGIIGDTYRRLDRLLDVTGPLQTKTVNAETENTRYNGEIEKLKLRMESMLARYSKQFAQMESLVGGVNAQKSSLKSTFEGMMSMYSNK